MSDCIETDALVERFLAALRAGESPDPDAFISAHPAQADELRELLPVVMEMEEYGRGARRSGCRENAAPPEIAGSDFRLEKEIGRGGMGSVWEATQISLNRKVAVKVMKKPIRDEKAWRERFARESRIVAQLHHPNIVKVYGAGTCGDICYYAMELVEGTGLDRHAFTDTRSAVKAVLQAAQALAYAHQCGVVHRDVKPANLMIDSKGDIHVTDFGLATAQAEGGDETSKDGTLRYMAPERLEGKCPPAVDQYALGVTLWELIARKPIFSGLSGSALVQQIRNGSVPRLNGIDADLSAVIAKSTRKSQDERYPSMMAFSDDLRAWLDGRCVSAARPSAMHRLRLWAKRKPAMAGLAAAAIICACGFAAALAVGFARTSAALGLAAKNASLADAALGDVFRHIERTSTSRRGAELLSALLPYYGQLAGEKGLDPAKAAEANEVLGVCAYRSGDYALAEQAFRRLIELRPSAKAMNRLSDTLRRTGRTEDAALLSKRVADRYADSKDARDRYEAALALETIGRQEKRHADRKRAFAIACRLREDDPSSSDFLFLYARLLAEYPSLAKGSSISNGTENAYDLLTSLAAKHPDRPEYSSALVSAMERRLRREKNPASIDRRDVELALDTADGLIGRYPNTPDIVSSVISFRDSYSSYLNRLGDKKQAYRERIRTSGMLELLSHSSEW